MFQIEELHKDDIRSEYESLYKELYQEDLPGNYFPIELDLKSETAFSCKTNGELIGLCFLFFEHDECRFGFFESKNDYLAIRVFLDYILKVAKSHGARKIIGPINKTTWNNYRWATEGSFPRFFTEPLQKHYYPKLLRDSGYEELTHYESRIEKNPKVDDSNRLKRIQDRLASNGITIRNLDMTKFEQEIGAIHKLICDLFKDQAYFQAIDKVDFIKKYDQLKSIIQPDYVFLAADDTGELCGLLFALPNYYDPSGIVIKTIACRSGRKTSGCIHLMRSKLIECFEKQGQDLKYIIHAFMRIDNSSLNISNGYDSEVLRKYSLFSKSIV